MRFRKPPDDLRDKYASNLSDMYSEYLDFLANRGSLASDSNPAIVVLDYIDEDMKAVNSFEEAFEGNRHSQGALQGRNMSNMDMNFVLALQQENLPLLGKAAKMKSAEYRNHEMLVVDFINYSGGYALTNQFLQSADNLVLAAIQSRVATIEEEDLDDGQKQAVGMELETEEEDEEENDEIENEVESTDGWL